MTYKLNSTHTAAVSTDTYWLPIDDDTPKGVKVLLLTKGGVAIISQYAGDANNYAGWFPMPKIRRSVQS